MDKAARVVRRLLEGTVIVFNGEPGPDTISKILGAQGAQGAEVVQSEPAAKLPAEGPVRDKFSITRKGKHWHFQIRRNEFGQISDIEVDEEP
jgi:hypothetical protein